MKSYCTSLKLFMVVPFQMLYSDYDIRLRWIDAGIAVKLKDSIKQLSVYLKETVMPTLRGNMEFEKNDCLNSVFWMRFQHFGSLCRKVSVSAPL